MASRPVVRFTRREREFVFAVAMRYMKDAEKAADVTQDALLLAYRHRDRFRGESRFTTWLYRIAATTALMHLRKERSTPRMKSLSPPEANEERAEELSAADSSPEELAAANEAVRLAFARLAEMGDKYATAFGLRFIEGYSEREVGRKLGLKMATAKTRAHRARVELARTLKLALAA
jgi:RNA polymerase sigma-70 factor (ECF subfamily)